MTDECGYPTEGGDGPPCQNPAGENGRCWIPSHTDPDAENPQGRDFKIDEGDHDDILETARMGASKAGCARAAGVGKMALQRYLDADENSDFRDAFMRARSDGEQRLLSGPLFNEENASREMDGQHARFLLSTSFDYQKTEKQEIEDVTEDGFGGGTEIVVTGEYDPNPDDGDK